MKELLLIFSCTLIYTSCASRTEQSVSSLIKQNEVKASRVVASEEVNEASVIPVSSKMEIEEFFNKNTCTIKSFDANSGEMVYERNLNAEIQEGIKKKTFFSTKTYIEMGKDMYDRRFAHVFVSYPLFSLDKWGGEQFILVFDLDKNTDTSQRKVSHNLYVAPEPSAFSHKPMGWRNQESLIGVNFSFQLMNGSRNYIFRCDPQV